MLKPFETLQLLSVLRLLREYFTLGVEGGETESTETAETETATETETDTETTEDVDTDTEGGEETETEQAAEPDEAPRRESRENRQIREQRERAQAERDARIKAETRLEEIQRQQQRPVADPTFDQEEQRLRAADVTELEKWQITANRELRAQRQQNNMVLFEARDTRDRTNFESYMRESHPGLLKAYAQKVEDKLAEARKNGGDVSRTVLFKLLWADDNLSGRVKGATKPTGAKKPAAVPRGQSPGARSDVQRGRATSHQKLAARLEGKQI
jgi:hypothetical protein